LHRSAWSFGRRRLSLSAEAAAMGVEAEAASTEVAVVAGFVAAGVSVAAVLDAKAGRWAAIAAAKGQCMADRAERCMEVRAVGCMEADRKAWAANRRGVILGAARLMGVRILRRAGIHSADLHGEDRRSDDLRLDDRRSEDQAAWPAHLERAARWKAAGERKCGRRWLTASGTRLAALAEAPLEAAIQFSRRD
jgi:hypothetical protein